VTLPLQSGLGKGQDTDNTSDTSSQGSNESDRPRLDKGKGRSMDNTSEFNYTGRYMDNTSEPSSPKSNTSQIFDFNH
jgi:hypothetical protein